MTPTRPRTPAPEFDKDELVELIAARLQPQLITIQAAVLRLEEQAKTDHQLTAKHEVTLYGNGDGRIGLITKISHLDRFANIGTWIAGIIAGAIITSAVGAFIYLVQTHPVP